MDALTILRCAAGCSAAKQWRTPSDCIDYASGSLFHVHSEPVSSLATLAATLDKLRAVPRCFIIRGALKPGRPQPVVRRHKRPEDPFADVARRWVMVDLDTRPDADGSFIRDPASAAADARAALPKPFQNAACYWHASGSAGLKPGVRLHLWFWCNRPVDSAEWRAWTKQWSVDVDGSVYRAVQPHYTADPLLGFPDPMAARSGLLAGLPDVQVPDIVGTPPALQVLADQTLERAVRKIKAAEQGSRNSTLYYQATRVAAFALILGERARKVLEDAATHAKMGATEVVATIESAFASTPSHPACDRNSWTRGMVVNQAGQFSASASNILQALQQHPGCIGVLETDERTQELRITRTPPWDDDELYGPYPRRLSDTDGNFCARWLEQELHLVGAMPRTVLDTMFAACRKQRVDLFREWLESLEWDGTPRLASWLQRSTSSPDDPVYLQAVGKRWLISAVARTFEPGCKADCMLVLVGAQGLRKSTLFERLAGSDWYRVMQAGLGSDDAYLQLQGPVIVEMSDLAGMKGRDIETIKADLSTACDERRPKYGRAVVKFPRRVVYAGTTNDDAFLHDVTGGRRFWPVNVDQHIDTDGVAAERDQLWAEAVAMYRAGEPWHLTSDENALALGHQEHARQEDSLEEMIGMWLRQPADPLTVRAAPDCFDSQRLRTRVTMTEIVRGLEFPIAHVRSKRFSDALRALGWTQQRKHRGARWYVRPGSHAPIGPVGFESGMSILDAVHTVKGKR